MKKIAILMIMLVLVSGLAMAENNTDNESNFDNQTRNNITVTNTTENSIEIEGEEVQIRDEEVKSFYNNGARVRMLQLIKQTTRNVLVGTEVIQYLDSDDVREEAKAILDELGSIILTVENYNFDSKTKDEQVEDFLLYKSSAIDLSKEFRELVGPELSEEDKTNLKEAIKEIDINDIKPLDDEIKALIREHNANVIQKSLREMNVEDNAAIEKIRNGELTAKEAKERVREQFNNLDKEKKLEQAKKIREDISSRNNYTKKIKNKVLVDVKEKVESRRVEQAKKITQTKLRIRSGELNEADIAARTRANSDKYKIIAGQRETLRDGNIPLEQKQAIRDIIDHRLNVGQQQIVKDMISDGELNEQELERIRTIRERKSSR